MTAEPDDTGTAETVLDDENDRATGIWTLTGGRPIIVDGEGPATILVPSESVRLIAADLPLKTRAKRREALPFAVEEQIADTSDSVHLALGAELSPKRYLVGVVAHDRMAGWVEQAEAAGLGHAALVPDALALPVPPDGCWSVDLGETRAVVRSADGTGFAVSAPMLRAAWERAGQPPCIAYGAELPDDMARNAEAVDAPVAGESTLDRLAKPALDLRQGAYARRRRADGHGYGRKIAWIVGLGAVAHILIAGADTLMLQSIAERRQHDTRLLVEHYAPGTTLAEDEDISGTVADMIPQPSGTNRFLPLVTRVSGVLAPMAATITMRAMTFQGDRLVMDLDSVESGMASRITGALRSANIPADVSESPDGAIRITARAA